MAQDRDYKNNQSNTNQSNTNQSNTSNRGFASMDADKQREIASQGGKAAHEKGTAHEFTPEEAREAGRRGGQARSSNQDSNQDEEKEAAQ